MSRHTQEKNVETCVIVWLEHDQIGDDSGECFNRYQRLVLQVQLFNEPNECIDYITDVYNQHIFFVLSASMANLILPLDLHLLPQINSIYIISSYEEESIKQIHKVKGIFIDRQSLFRKLQEDFYQLERDLISFDLLSPTDSSNTQEATFMYAQLIKEIFLEMTDNNIVEMLEYLRSFYTNNSSQLQLLDEFERDYCEDKAITWYSRDSPFYRIVNQAIRIQDMTTLYKMRTFIRHLHNQLAKLYEIQNDRRGIKLYRGQRIASIEFERIKNNIHGLLSIKNFLSTTANKNVALMFAGESTAEEIAILMEIEIDNFDDQPTSYFANIEQLSYFGTEEQEWLFSMGSVFRILNLELIENNHIWLIQMKITDKYDKQLTILTQHLRWSIQTGIVNPLYSFAKLLFYMGNYKESNKYLRTTLDLETDSKQRMSILHAVGMTYIYMEMHQSGLDIFHQIFQLQLQQTPDTDDPIFENTYSAMGMLYVKMGQYDQGLECFRHSLRLISNNADYSNQLRMISLYINIGTVYWETGQLDKALENYKQALNMSFKNLSPIDIDIAVIYNNISKIYHEQGRYEQALDMNKKSFEIKQASLPPDHPSLAIACLNLADIYENIGRYEDALLLCQQALDIQIKQFSLNHPSIVETYSQIAIIYRCQGRHENALEIQQKALDIKINSLPTDHKDIGVSYNNLCTVLCDLKRFDEALACAHQALIIYQRSLPPTHPLITKLYSNMGSIYDSQKNYEQALHMYQNALNIQLNTPPKDHPTLAVIYHNMSTTLRSMHRLDEALENASIACDISTRALGSEHSQTKLIQYHLQLTKDSMS